jgi:hypothetical protein
LLPPRGGWPFTSLEAGLRELLDRALGRVKQNEDATAPCVCPNEVDTWQSAYVFLDRALALGHPPQSWHVEPHTTRVRRATNRYRALRRWLPRRITRLQTQSKGTGGE